jgi:hypothetical protein
MTKALKSRIDLVRSPFNFTKPCFVKGLFTWTVFFVSRDIKRPQLEKDPLLSRDVARQGFHSSCKYPL